jgi:hypothetical protein
VPYRDVLAEQSTAPQGSARTRQETPAGSARGDQKDMFLCRGPALSINQRRRSGKSCSGWKKRIGSNACSRSRCRGMSPLSHVKKHSNRSWAV